jgi:hypothetical protein
MKIFAASKFSQSQQCHPLVRQANHGDAAAIADDLLHDIDSPFQSRRRLLHLVARDKDTRDTRLMAKQRSNDLQSPSALVENRPEVTGLMATVLALTTGMTHGVSR